MRGSLSSAGDRQPLPLTHRQQAATLADQGVVAFRQAHDHLMGVRRASRGLDVGCVGMGSAKRIAQ